MAEGDPRQDSVEVSSRDVLAEDRTVLANERTFLAYVRTALTLVVAGMSFVKFFGSPIIEALGWVFVPLGAGVFLVGLWRYFRMRAMIPARRALAAPKRARSRSR